MFSLSALALVIFGIDFKILMLTFKAQCGLAPGYISDVPGCNLRSLTKAILTISQSRLKTKGDWIFYYDDDDYYYSKALHLTSVIDLMSSGPHSPSTQLIPPEPITFCKKPC